MNNLADEQKVTFLVGAGRSGTTLLYKLLCLHPGIAYISNYENKFKWFPDGLAAGLISNRIDAKVNAWFNKRGNAYFINRPLAKKVFPTPHEGESVYASCGMPLRYWPGHYPNEAMQEGLRTRFMKIQTGAKAQIFLSKRTANNRRITQLQSIFPNAQYIHLIRDGREVAHSLSRVEWWNNHTVWWDGRTALQMERAGEDRLTICAKNWAYEMRELRKQLATINNERILELRFENLLSNPIDILKSILNFLGLTMTTDFCDAVDSLELSHRLPAWTDRWTTADLACVLQEQQLILRELGYINQEHQLAP
jgi:hypothetical protein